MNNYLSLSDSNDIAENLGYNQTKYANNHYELMNDLAEFGAPVVVMLTRQDEATNLLNAAKIHPYMGSTKVGVLITCLYICISIYQYFTNFCFCRSLISDMPLLRQ